MALEKKVYTLSDFKEQDLDTAPSLDLPALCIEKFYLPKDGGKMMLFLANVRSDWLPRDGCPYCHRQDTLVLSGRTKPRVIRDVVRNNYCVQIVTQSQRMQCKECKARFTPKIDGIVENGTMTERLEDFIKTESFLQPHTVLSERTGLSIQTIQNIMDVEIDRYEEMRRKNPPKAPRVLGIDEKHIAHIMRGTLVDVEEGNLLDMTETNDESVMKTAICNLKDWDKNIEVVTTDMANSYLRWMPALLPKAIFVIDKFHVIQDVENKISTTKNALYSYRKSLIQSLNDDDEKAKQYEILRIVNDNKRLFNYSMENIVRDKSGRRALKLNAVMDAFPEFRLLRMLYFYIEDMYEKETRAEAEKAWNEWIELLPPIGKKEYEKWCDLYSVDKECFEAFRSLSRAGFTRFKPYILNYFNPGCRHTNAATEGLNNLIGGINISGNGYRFRHLRAKALYASLIHQRVFYSFDISSVQAWKPKMNFQFGLNRGEEDEYRWIRKYDFTEMVIEEAVPETNVLFDTASISTRFESEFNQEASPVIEEETVIQRSWRILQPNEKERRMEELLEKWDNIQ